MKVHDYIKKLLSQEEYSFSVDEFKQHSHKSDVAITRELSRLVAKGEIVNLRKGYYIILPPRYSAQQKLPIQLYSEKLCNYLGRKYYVALFSAAKFHGAGHQQIQKDYIIQSGTPCKNIEKKTFEIRFFTTSHWPQKNIYIKKSDAGIFHISSPALTIADLIYYQTKIGGIHRILTVIEELIDEVQEQDIIELLSWYPHTSVLQRMGYLFEELKIKVSLQNLLFEHLSKVTLYPVLLCPNSNQKTNGIHNTWKVKINSTIELDI